MSKGGMHPEDVRAEIKKIDESTNCSGRDNTYGSLVYGARKTAKQAHSNKSAAEPLKESAFAESNRSQRRR